MQDKESAFLELLAKVPSEAWVGLAGVVIGALLSIFGAWLTNKSSLARLHIQLEHQEKAQNKKARQEKLEELYVLLGHWINTIFSNYMMLTLVMKGQMDYNKYLDEITKHAKEIKYDFNRLELIIEVYAQELKPKYEEVLAARTRRNDVEAEHKKAYKSGEIEATRFLKPFTVAQTELEELTEELRKEVAALARNA